MRVAVVHSFYTSEVPSGENVVVELQIEALRRVGHEVRLIARRTDDVMTSRLAPLRAAVTVATGRGPAPLEELREFRPDVIHVHNLFPNFGQDWVEKAPAPVVATLHNFRPLCANGLLFRDGRDCAECVTKGSWSAVKHGCYRGSRAATVPLAIATRGRSMHNALLGHAAALVALAPRSAETYVKARPDLAPRLHTIPNFAPEPSIEWRPPQPTDPWIYVGRLSEEKGILALIEAWPQDEPLIVVGSGPQADAAKDAAREKRVTFSGRLPRDEVDALLATSRALVFPSVCRETQGMTYVEALSLGRPVLSIGSHAVADDVKDGSTGISLDYAAPRRVPELREALAALQGDLNGYSVRAAARYLDKFSEAGWLDRAEQLYRAVAHRS